MSSPTTAPPHFYSTNSNPYFEWYKNPAASMFQFSHPLNRNPSSPASSGSSKIVVIESEEQFKSSLRKVQDESLSAIFYYTAVWCSPCRLLSPIIKQLSEKYPNVTTYKVDIDHKGLGNALRNMDIHSVPTVHLFRNGLKANEVIGADVQLLKNMMEKLYK
ncbi:Thioredoxin domain-containing protein [Heracleum sosnowskyi]|uniref:Thioredoxin domain-containing protein n=1 Tax=Heracleum sosnowskyi TaxID=360622 RepID=A0AAD8MTT8_9APIA|nr:Thioredoxin domain-containing protein [Heracleum sosnowskyi]